MTVMVRGGGVKIWESDIYCFWNFRNKIKNAYWKYFQFAKSINYILYFNEYCNS